MKRRRRLPRQGVCIYCGEAGSITDDHVPPVSLFRSPRPSNLVTVPSCLKCNQGASMDDEYFRAMVALRHDIDHPDAGAARESVMRSLLRPQAGRFRTDFLATVREIELRTQAGLYLGHLPSYQPDPERLCRAARRYTLGLFYHETGRRLPADHGARTILPSALGPDAADTLNGLADIARAVAATNSPHFAGRGVLSYWWDATPEDENTTAWFLVFYGRVMFVTLTAPVTVSSARAAEAGSDA